MPPRQLCFASSYAPFLSSYTQRKGAYDDAKQSCLGGIRDLIDGGNTFGAGGSASPRSMAGGPAHAPRRVPPGRGPNRPLLSNDSPFGQPTFWQPKPPEADGTSA